jgi:hypothetical protein
LRLPKTSFTGQHPENIVTIFADYLPGHRFNLTCIVQRITQHCKFSDLVCDQAIVAC